jgi:hypothetical protein
VRGDFSRWQFQPRDNFNGILPQQGKLLIDADGLAQSRIANHWQQVAARDWVGPVAAVPANEPASFQITGAAVNPDGTVTLTAGSGRIWADGMLVELGGEAATVQRTATWLEPPIVPTQGSAATAAGAQDVVVLELWQEGINGYQMPNLLIEPALGGVDTAERLHTGMAFRLARLTAGQTCKSVAFNDSGLGKLTASLQPVTVIAGDCPIPVGGGYSGFEHALYRIEIADVPSGSPRMFKWSSDNGGLVGRGTFKPGPNTLTINANLVAITTANQPGFYVEIEQWDAARGNWQVVCGGNATLANDTLTFTGAAAYGAYPAAQGDVFFRLWEGIDAISAFPIQASPNQLEDGIFLQFDADAPGLYRPRDYWVFAVRAGGISNPQTLIDKKPPEGIVYHRVPLAEITWDATGKVQTIDDCRATITPLTSARGCCTVQVGDGLTTFAPFTSIQAAMDSLPAEGGEVCILAGRYFESISVSARTNVTIHGCGHHTRIASPSLGPNQGANTGAVITVLNSREIALRSLVVEAADGDMGIELAGTSAQALAAGLAAARLVQRGVTDVTLRELIVISSNEPAVSVEEARGVRLEDSIVAMRDVLSASAAVYVSGQEIHVTNNWVGPITAAVLPATVGADLGSAAAAGASAFATSPPMAKAPCGIQIAGISSDVYVRYNEIDGGSGNGITLGGIILVDSTGTRVNGYIGYNPSGGTQNPCSGGSFYYTGTVIFGGQNVSVVVDGRLTNLRIENNRIRNMGLCGIGPIGFFNLKDTQEVVTVNGLWIVANEISACLRRTLTQYTAADSTSIGYGGVCLPDVTETFIRDNLILNTGASLADPACGIFVLHGALVEISRNRIEDTRDWSTTDAKTISGYRAGISLVMVTPQDAAAAAGSSWNVTGASPIYTRQSLYEHGAPALCIQENVVDIPAGLALVVAGLGAFSILGNHFSTGGAQGGLLTLARSILIFNFGTPVEYPAPVATSAEFLALLEALNAGASSAQALQTVLGSSATIVGAIAPGPVDFSQNRCSLRQAFQASAAIASVWITTFDDLGFHDNQCWMATSERELGCDALLLGFTVRATGCRFQEIPGTVYLSALTFGLMNITSLNEATHPLGPIGPATLSVTTGNVVF